MIRWKKAAALFAAAAMAVAAMAPCAMAASRSKVGKIYLTFNTSDVRVGCSAFDLAG